MEKTERFGFWLTTSEKILLVQLAEMEGGLSLAALIRRLVREAAQKRGILLAEHSPTTSGKKEATND